MEENPEPTKEHVSIHKNVISTKKVGRNWRFPLTPHPIKSLSKEEWKTYWSYGKNNH